MRSTSSPSLAENHVADMLLVSTQSALKRRRERAAYSLNDIRSPNRARRALLLFVLGCLVVALLGQINSVRTSAPQNRALPVTNLSPVNQFDRFTINYDVRDGDSLWIITSRFYGKPSLSKIRKIKEANPWLPENDGELRIGVTLKIPIQ